MNQTLKRPTEKGALYWIKLFYPLIALLAAFLVCGLFLLAIGSDPLRDFAIIARGAFGGIDNITGTLASATPVIAVGLAVAFAQKSGLFNIGGEGQLYIGGLLAALAGHYIQGLPVFIHLPLCVVIGIAGGALWGGIAGALRAYRGSHEVVVTIMLNYVAYAIMNFAGETLKTGSNPKTPKIMETAMLPKIGDSYNLNVSFFIVIGACILITWIMKRTSFGYEIKAVGQNPTAAGVAGIKVKKIMFLVMMISGGIAALAGVDRVLGIHHSALNNMSTGFGFEGIAVALLAKNNTMGVILSGILFGALSTGAQELTMYTDLTNELAVIIQAIVILFITIDPIIDLIASRRASKRKEAA